MSNSIITTKQAITIVLTVLIAYSFLSLPNIILQTTSVSSLINTIYITILTTIFIYVVYRLFKSFPGSDILDICEYTFGKAIKNILGILLIFSFILSSALLLRNFSECLKIVYYPMTDVFFIMLFFIIAISITNKLNFASTLKANVLITPIVIASILFLFTSNVESFSFERAFPILGNGIYSTFVLGITNVFCFSGIAFLYFLPPLLKEPEKFKRICITSIVLSGIYLFITLAIIIFLFPIFYNTVEIMPLYTAARYIEFGTFFQRLESIFLLIWIYVFTCYLSISTRFSMLIFKKITNIKDSKYLIYPFSILLLAIGLIPKNFAILTVLESTLNKYTTLIITFVISFIILIIGNIKKKIKK